MSTFGKNAFGDFDATYLDSLRKQDDDAQRRKNEFLLKNAPTIRYNYGRGMSRKTLIDKYGEAAVTACIGAIAAKKEDDDGVLEPGRGRTTGA